MLFAFPHGEVTRTQNCVGAMIEGVMSVGALPPTGRLKSITGPTYH